MISNVKSGSNFQIMMSWIIYEQSRILRSFKDPGKPKLHAHIHNPPSATASKTTVWFFSFPLCWPAQRTRTFCHSQFCHSQLPTQHWNLHLALTTRILFKSSSLGARKYSPPKSEKLSFKNTRKNARRDVALNSKSSSAYSKAMTCARPRNAAIILIWGLSIL